MRQNRDFVPTNLKINCLPFLRPMGETVDRVLAKFFYIHHDMRLEQINAAIAENNCSLATEDDLINFLRLYQGAIGTLTIENAISIIATDPTSYSKSQDSDTLVPAIYHKSDPGKPGVTASMARVSLIGDLVPGHEFLVMAIQN